eukprot:gene19712-22490_t
MRYVTVVVSAGGVSIGLTDPDAAVVIPEKGEGRI